jgi:NAD(P)-dependent dehydrogenase (short-subunit alcohol dehydrogenase family)
MIDHRERWALVLGASSGFGEATALALAADGYHVCGVHLDRKAGLGRVEQIRRRIEAHGQQAHFFNRNAADDEQRTNVLSEIGELFAASRARGGEPYLRVLMHSLAFGTLKPYLALDPADGITRRNLEMTLDVMANSLVYWAQDAWRMGLLGQGSRIYAMTSEGSTRVIPSYGAVSAAKCALESHVRQLALEFGKLGSGITINAVRAGVTMTPSMLKIAERDQLIGHGERNPSGRMTTVEDVAQAIVTLAGGGTHWITGNVIGVDGGELIGG